MTLEVLWPSKSNCSDWAAVHGSLLRKLVVCLKYDTDSDLDHLPAAMNSLSKGIEMANKPQGIKLWMACFEVRCWVVPLVPHLSAVRVMCLGPETWNRLARHPGCFLGKTILLQEALMVKTESKNNVQQLSTEALREVSHPAKNIFGRSVEKIHVVLCLEPWLPLAYVDGWIVS